MNQWHYASARDLGLKVGERHCSPHREHDFTEDLLRLGWLASLRLIFRLWNRLEVHGLENLPAHPPFVLTANHTSHLDALVIASALSLSWRDQISPLAAGDYFFCSKTRARLSALILNALPIWRHRQRGQRHELGDLRDRLQEQSAIYIIFPEGSRARDGQLHEFKPGFATLVAGTRIPVLPCHLSGSFAALPPDKNVVRPKKITLHIGAPLTFEAAPNHAAGWRQICTVVLEKTVALQSHDTTPASSPHGDWHDKLLLTFRFARFFLHRQLRNMATRLE